MVSDYSIDEKANLVIALLVSMAFISLGAYHAYLTYQFKYNGIEKNIYIEEIVDVKTRVNRVIYYTYKVIIDDKHIIIKHDYELPVSSTFHGIILENKNKISITPGNKSDTFVSLYISVAGGSLLSVIELIVVFLIIIVWLIVVLVKLNNRRTQL